MGSKSFPTRMSSFIRRCTRLFQVCVCALFLAGVDLAALPADRSRLDEMFPIRLRAGTLTQVPQTQTLATLISVMVIRSEISLRMISCRLKVVVQYTKVITKIRWATWYHFSSQLPYKKLGLSDSVPPQLLGCPIDDIVKS